MVVAAWQAYVQNVLVEALDAIASDINDPAGGAPSWARQAYAISKATILRASSRFLTPSDVNVRDLLRDALDFNPWPSWPWRATRRQWDEEQVRRRTNEWVMVRHSIAHGFDLPPNYPWLRGTNGQPRLTLGLLRECQAHFMHLAAQTDRALSAHLVAQYGLIPPW
jgi:hypothetical protein